MTRVAIGVGTNANDGTGDPLRTAFQSTNTNFSEIFSLQSQTINAGSFTGTADQKVQSAITAAASAGYSRVFVPSSFAGYNATLVTFNTSVQMVFEGASWENFDIRAYGATGDSGTTDNYTAIQAAINGAIANGGTVLIPGLPDRYYKVTQPLVATLAAAQVFCMSGDGLRSVIYSTASGDILTIDGSGVASGRTVPYLADFTLAGSSATQDGVVLNYTHRGTIRNVFVISCGRWAWNYKSCFLNTMTGGGGTINVGAVGNIPTQPAPKGMLRLGDGTMGGGSNVNTFIGASFEGSQKTGTAITGASSTTPIVITSVAHGMNTGDVVGIASVGGNTAANGAWAVTVTGVDTFSLDTSTWSSGAYTSGGTSNAGVGIYIQTTSNSYGNVFVGGTAENNSVGVLIASACTINSFMGTDTTGNYFVEWQDRGTLNNFFSSGSGGAVTSFGGPLNINGPVTLATGVYFMGNAAQGTVFNDFGSAHNVLILDINRNIVVGEGTLATTATDGFLYIPASAGAPTGVPTAKSGRVTLHYDSTNNNFYVYNGAWKKVTLT